MSKWTPGPWIFEPDGDDAFRIKSEDFGGIAYLHDPSAVQMGRFNGLRADAALIAAAPEMAEVLERLSIVIHNCEIGGAALSDEDDATWAEATALLERIGK